MKKLCLLSIVFVTAFFLAGLSFADSELLNWCTFKAKITLKTGKTFTCYATGSEDLAKASGEEILRRLQTREVLIFKKTQGSNFNTFYVYRKIEKLTSPFIFYASSDKALPIKIDTIIKVENLGLIFDGPISGSLSKKVISLLKKEPFFILKTNLKDPCDLDESGWKDEFLVYNSNLSKEASQKTCDQYSQNWINHFDKKCNFIADGETKSYQQFINHETEKLLNLNIVVLHESTLYKQVFGDASSL